MTARGADSQGAESRWLRLWGIVKLLLGGVSVGSALELLGVPAGMLIGSIIGSALVNQPWTRRMKPARLPILARQIGLITVGLAAGVLLTVDSLLNTAAIALPVVLAYLGLTALNLIFITVLMSRYQVDPVTAVLAVTPGGLAEVTSIAIDKGAQVAVVLSVHAVRLFSLVLVILPILLLVLS